MFDVLTLWLIIWVLKNAAMDVASAVTGKPNPRYELKKAKAKAAGQAAPAQPRYGSRDWLADLLSDGLQAQTDWRRRKTEAKRRERDEQEAAERERKEQARQEAAEGAAEGEQPGRRPGDGEQPEPRRRPDGGPQEKPQLWNWQCARRPDCPARGFGFTTSAEALEAKRRHEQVLCAFRPGGERADERRAADERTWRWECDRAGCNAGGAGYASEREAVAAADRHEALCRPQETPAEQPQPQPEQQQPADRPQPGYSWVCGRWGCPAEGGGFGSREEAQHARRLHQAYDCQFADQPQPQQEPGQGQGQAQTYRWACRRCPATADGYASPQQASAAHEDHFAVCPGLQDVRDKHAQGLDCGEQGCLACADKHRQGSTNDVDPEGTGCPRCGGQLQRLLLVHGEPRRFKAICAACGTFEVRPTADGQPADQTSGPAAGGEPGPEQQQTPADAPRAGEDGPTAKVYQFPNPSMQEETVSTDVNAEVVGLDQSIAYAEQLAAFAGEHGASGNEGYIGHLTDSQVGGEALASAGEMQEAFALAQAAAERHAELLKAQKAVQEAYESNADAGDKAYLLDGR